MGMGRGERKKEEGQRGERQRLKRGQETARTGERTTPVFLHMFWVSMGAGPQGHLGGMLEALLRMVLTLHNNEGLAALKA